MSILPVAAGVSLAQIAPAAGAAVSSAASGFLNLLQSSLQKGAEAISAGASASAPPPVGGSVIEPSASDPDSLRARLGRLLAAFQETVGQAMDSGGAAFDRTLAVVQKSDGRLEVGGGAPQHDAAQAALDSTPALRDLFAAIAQASRQLNEAVLGGNTMPNERPTRLLVSPDGATVA